MAQMLRQKHTGDLFIYTSALAALPEMELVVEDTAKVVAEVLAETTSQADLIDPDVHVEDVPPVFTPERKQNQKRGK